MQSRESLFDQTKMASNGELEAFRNAVLHLKDGRGGGVRHSRNPTGNGVVVVPSVGLVVHVSTGTSGRCATTS